MQYQMRFIELPRNDNGCDKITAELNKIADAGFTLKTLIADHIINTNGAGGWSEASGPPPPDTRTIEGYTRGAWLIFESEHATADPSVERAAPRRV